MFLTLIVVGLTGLGLMAIPGLNRHARGGFGRMAPHAGHVSLGGGARHAPQAPAPNAVKSSNVYHGSIWQIPSPRMIFSLLALYGASGYGLVEAAHVNQHVAALIAVVPAVLLEHFVMTPLWNLMFRFQGTPSESLDQLILSEARAVTPFRNQKGLVSVTHNGRLVQFRAELSTGDSAAMVRVGDRLIVEDVDAAHERVTVAVVAPDVDDLSV